MRDCLHSQKKQWKKSPGSFGINCLRNFPYFTKMIFKKIFVFFSSVIIMFIVLYACKNKHFQLNEFLAKKSQNLYGRISIDVSVTESLCITATLNLGKVSSCSHTATLRAGNLTVQVQSLSGQLYLYKCALCWTESSIYETSEVVQSFYSHHFPPVFTYYQLYLFLKFITEEDKSSK